MKIFPVLPALVVVTTAVAAPLKIELPPETPHFKKSPRAELVMSQCLMCHSAEYITTQPPLSPAAWKASVEKMQKKYGAPIPADQVDALVDYIVKNYGAPVAAPTSK